MGLRAKFNLVMLVAFAVGLGLAAVLVREIADETARRQVLQEASMIMRHASAVRTYTSGEIRPLLADQMTERFLPQSVPSYAAQTVFRHLHGDFPDYAYKEAALNPTNPADRATQWEADIIALFRQDRGLAEHVSVRDTPTGPMVTFARPFRLTDRACLSCHSTPAAAPATMVDLYGPNNGFGWVHNDVIGAQIVSVPMRVALERAKESLYGVLAAIAAAFLLMLLVMNLLLHFVIIRPVQRITGFAEKAASGELEGEELKEGEGRDEIASLARSFNLLRRSLARSMAMLERA